MSARLMRRCSCACGGANVDSTSTNHKPHRSPTLACCVIAGQNCVVRGGHLGPGTTDNIGTTLCTRRMAGYDRVCFNRGKPKGALVILLNVLSVVVGRSDTVSNVRRSLSTALVTSIAVNAMDKTAISLFPLITASKQPTQPCSLPTTNVSRF
jgi:hypothetical protein